MHTIHVNKCFDSKNNISWKPFVVAVMRTLGANDQDVNLACASVRIDPICVRVMPSGILSRVNVTSVHISAASSVVRQMVCGGPIEPPRESQPGAVRR